MKPMHSPEVRAAFRAAIYAREIGLPAGNLWEPPIARHLLAEWRASGYDELVWARLDTEWRMRLSLSPCHDVTPSPI